MLLALAARRIDWFASNILAYYQMRRVSLILVAIVVNECQAVL